MNELVSKLDSARKTLPRKQRIVCDYIYRNLYEASTLNITELAEKVGVGNTTVIRILEPLGYSSYLDLKADLKKIMLEDNYSYNRNVAFQLRMLSDPENGDTTGKHLHDFSQAVADLGTPEYVEAIKASVKRIISSRIVYTIGARTSAAFSAFISATFKTIGLHTVDLGARIDYLYDNLAELTPDDCAIIVMSHPVAAQSARAAQILEKRGVPLILISDVIAAEPYRNTAILLDVKSEYRPSSSVSIMATIETLRLEVSKELKEVSRQHLDRMNAFAREYGTESDYSQNKNQ